MVVLKQFMGAREGKKFMESLDEPTAHALAKLIYYSLAMAVVPIVTYQMSERFVAKKLSDVYQTKFLEDTKTCSGLFAVLSVQCVLVMYVVSALRENSRMETTSATTAKKKS
jgi:uncharacterized membrane protein YqgA involved in biofilm formation